VAALWQRYVAQHPQIASIQPAFAVNHAYAPGHRPLADGDEVAFIPPVSGGSGPFLVTEQEIDLAALWRAVADPGAGAIVTFHGVVRDNSRGRPVRYLEYEAYKEMAERTLAQIAQEIAARWGLEHVAIVHRVGHLEIGEASVVIAVAAPHRREAFAACTYAIDRLKEIAPIWKKEFTADGAVWVEGPGEGK
jgi:molybdopterin synthase catalytic subunit